MTTEPSYDVVSRDSEVRDGYQKPFRKLFEKAKTPATVAALVAKHEGTYDSVPWVAWIVRGLKLDAKKLKDYVALLEKLIGAGANLALYDEHGRLEPHALADLLRLDELPVTSKVKLLELAIAKGAGPADRLAYPLWASEGGPFSGYEITRSALDVALADDEHPELLAAIVPHVSTGTLEDAYLRNAIANLGSDTLGGLLDRAGDLNRVVTKLESTETAALVHFACEAEAPLAAFDTVIGRADVNLPLATPMSTRVPYRWGVTPTLRLPAGATPLDIVEAILRCVVTAETSNASKPHKDFRTDDAAKVRALAEAKRDRLVARGAARSTPSDTLDLPPAILGTAEQLLRLAKLLGHDPAPIREAFATVDTDGMGPWGFLREIVPPFETSLTGDALSPALAQLLTAFTTDRWSAKVRSADLPSSVRKSIDIAIAFHDDDDGKLMAVKTGGGTQIWKLADGETSVVAPSVAAYLEAEIDRWQR